jgi:hypothetical protein
MVVITEEQVIHSTSEQTAFRFEAGWIQEETCEAIVENAWKLSTNVRGGTVGDAVRDVAADLWDRKCNVLGDLEKRIKKGVFSLRS